METKEFVFEILIKKYTRCINIKVENGEIVYANECYSRTRRDIVKNKNPHDLSKNSPNWKAVKKYLTWYWIANRKDFCEMYICLNLSSEAYRIVKDIMNKRYYELKKELETIEKMAHLSDLINK